MTSPDVAAIGIAMETDGIDRGINRLEVLASKGAPVEKAMAGIEGAVKRTGKTLENLGASAGKGVSSIGDGAPQAASKIEGASKTAADSLKNIGAQAEAVKAKTTQALDSVGMSAKQTAAAMRQVPAQFQDIVVSLQGGMNPLTEFMQQGSQLATVFGGAGAAAKALGGYVVGLVSPFTVAAAAGAALGVAYYQGSKEADSYRNALIQTGNAAGTTAAQMKAYAQEISSVVGTQGKAAESLAAFASSGKVTSDILKVASQAAVSWERSTGQALDKTAEQFAALRNDPLSAVMKLNDGMNFLTDSTYKQIKSLDEQGKTAEAANVAQRAFADTLAGRAGEMERNLGSVERGWLAVKDAAKGAWDAILNVGRASTNVDQLAEVRRQIALRENQIANAGFATNEGGAAFGRPSQANTDRLRAELAGLQAQAAALEGVANQTRIAAEEERKRGEAVKATAAFDKAGEKYLTDKARMERELADARVLGAAAGKSQAEIEQRLAQIRASYAKKGGSTVAAENKELREQERIFAQLNGVASTYYADLAGAQKQRAAGVLTEARYVEYVNELIQKQPFAVALAKEQADATKAQAKASEDAVRSYLQYLDSFNKGADSAERQVAALQAEEQASAIASEGYYSLAQAVELVSIARLKEQQIGLLGNEEAYLAVQREIEAREKLVGLIGSREARKASEDAAKDAQRDWERAAADIERALTDSLLRGFESGKGFAENLIASLKNMFSTLVLRPIISAVVNPVAGAITGALGLAGTANAATGGAAAAGGAGNLLTAASLAGNSSFMMGLSGAWGAGGGLVSTLNAGASLLQTGTLSSITSGLGTIAGALSPIALGFVALSSLIKKSTPHTGGIGAYSADSGATTGASVGLAFGIDQKHYTQAGEELSTSVAKGIVQILDSTAATFGKQAGYYAATAFADDSSKDGAWGALRIKFGEKVLLDWADTAMRDANVPREFADGEAGQKQYLAAVAADVRVALDSIGLPAWATGMLDKLGQGASIEQLAGAVDQINAAKVAFAGFAQYMPTFAGLADTAISKLVDASGGVQALTGNLATFVDQFYTEAEKLAVNTENVRAAMDKLGFAMPATREEFAALVKANVALGDAGAETVAKLLQVAGAFASVTAASDTVTAAAAAAAAAASDRKAFVQARREAQESAQKAELDAIEAAKTAAADLFKSIQDHIQGIDDWLKGTLLDTNSLLSPEGKVQEAQVQFDALYALAVRGDADAMGKLTDAASALRDVARDAYASSGAYGSIEMDLRARLEALDAGKFDPNRMRDPMPSGARPAGEALNLAETMALTGLGAESASLLTSLNRYDKSFLDGLKGLSQADATQALLQANRSIALGDGSANFYREIAPNGKQEYLRIALANGSFASAGGGADAGNVYRLGLQLGLTDAEVRQGLGLMGKGAQADSSFWQSNWMDQSSAISNWVHTSGQGPDTLASLYELNKKMFESYKEAVDAIRGSGEAQAQGQAQQIELLQSVDKRLADQASDSRMGAIA